MSDTNDAMTASAASGPDAVQLGAVKERPLPSECDVVVIGGGIMGAAAAYYLSDKGRSVVLIEKGRIAGEQSGRNWGWVRQQGRDIDELPLMIESNRIWQSAEADLGVDIEWTQSGILALARDSARMAFFEAWVKEGHAAGLDSRLLEPAEIQPLVPGLTGEWLGALFTPSDGHAEPAKATWAFARAAENLGATLIEGCAVDRIIDEGGRVSGVATERGVVRADRVVCAAGVWSARLLRPLGIDLPVRFVRSSVASTTPVAPLTEMAVGNQVVSFRQRPDGTLYLAAGGWSDYDLRLDSFRHLRMFLPNYIKNRRLIRLHVGRALFADIGKALFPWKRDRHPWRTQRMLDPPANPQKVRTSVEEFRKLFPNVEFDVVNTWAGYIDATPDAVPVIDALDKPDGLVLATGFSGHGFAMGPIVGRLIAELIVEGHPSLDLTAFRFSRFQDGTYKKPRLVS